MILNEDNPKSYVTSFLRKVINGNETVEEFNESRINAEKNNPRLVLSDGSLCQMTKTGMFVNDVVKCAQNLKWRQAEVNKIRSAVMDYVRNKAKVSGAVGAASVVTESYFNY